MAIAQFSTPKQWEDWCSWLLGIWLCLSPWTLGFGLDPNATEATVVGGLLIIAAGVRTLSVFSRSMRLGVHVINRVIRSEFFLLISDLVNSLLSARDIEH